MKAFVLVALAGCAHVAMAADPKPYACDSSAGMLKQMGDLKFNSRGDCHELCVTTEVKNGGDGYAVMAMTKGTLCYCGNTLPNDSLKVDDAKCKQPCPGFAPEMCGSRLGEYFSVYTTGLEEDPEMDEAPSSSASSASKTSSASDVESTSRSSTGTAATSTADSQQQTATPEKATSKAAVAAGTVIGVLAIIGLGVGVFVFLRRRRRQEVEEEYRRSAAVRGFVQKPSLDNRLDPVMVQRRDSVGSIADNQDYSRKILRATNPDG